MSSISAGMSVRSRPSDIQAISKFGIRRGLLNRRLHLLGVKGIGLLEILEIEVVLNERAGHRLVVDRDGGLRPERLDPGIGEIDLGNTTAGAAGLELNLDRLGPGE